MNAAERAQLEKQGLVFAPSIRPFLAQDAWRENFELAYDAQPALVTTPNAAIPAFLANVVDPQMVRVIVAPMRAEQIFGSTKKGDWTTLTAQFPVAEATGEVSSYGDWNKNGSSGANFNWVPRQSYHFQTITQYGERELDMYGLAGINYKSELDVSSALVINKFHNRMAFYGVAGLQNYGALNDPNLLPNIIPNTKAAGGTAWTNATADEIYSDVLKLFGQLQTQMGGNIDFSEGGIDETIVLAMSPERAVLLQRTNTFGINVQDLLQKNFKNLTIRTAPEYNTAGGQLMQMLLPNYEGVDSAFAGFTEKLRAHAVIQDLSGFQQKKSAGGWGTIIRRPIAIAGEIGI